MQSTAQAEEPEGAVTTFEQVAKLWVGLTATAPLWEVLNMAALHDSLAAILENDAR